MLQGSHANTTMNCAAIQEGAPTSRTKHAVPVHSKLLWHSFVRSNIRGCQLRPGPSRAALSGQRLASTKLQRPCQPFGKALDQPQLSGRSSHPPCITRAHQGPDSELAMHHARPRICCLKQEMPAEALSHTYWYAHMARWLDGAKFATIDSPTIEHTCCGLLRSAAIQRAHHPAANVASVCPPTF